MITQNADDRVGTEHALPTVRLGQFIGHAPFAPGRMLAMQCNDPGLKDWIRACWLFRGGAREVFKSSGPTALEAGFPIIKGASSDMGGSTRERDIVGGFPRFKQQTTLLSGSQRKMNAFGHGHTIA